MYRFILGTGKHFAFKVGSVVMQFNVLCFDIAHAYYVFTKVMQEPVVELRSRGIPISDYIDDGLTAAKTRNRCLRQSTISALFSTLGAYFGIPKCQFDPAQLLKWLGFMVDSWKQIFLLGESKLAKLKAELESLVREPSTSFRKLAKVAGKIIAASPAVLPALLYSRALLEAMHGKVAWDVVFPTPESVKETARFWLDNLDRFMVEGGGVT
jgi:hypothetical protein